MTGWAIGPYERRPASVSQRAHEPAAPGLGEQPVHSHVLARKGDNCHEYQPVGALPVGGNVPDDIHRSHTQQDRVDQSGPVSAARHEADQHGVEQLENQLIENDGLRRPQRPAVSDDDSCVNKRQPVRCPQCCHGPLDSTRLDSLRPVGIRYMSQWRLVRVVIGMQLSQMAC